MAARTHTHARTYARTIEWPQARTHYRMAAGRRANEAPRNAEHGEHDVMLRCAARFEMYGVRLPAFVKRAQHTAAC